MVDSTAETLVQTQKEAIHADLQVLMQSVINDNNPDQVVIDRLTALNPEDLTTAIFDNPPAVTVTNKDGEKIKLQPTFDISQPTPKEIEYAKKEIPTPNKLRGDEVGYYKDAVSRLKQYLRAPRITDSFTDHVKERRVWENAIRMVLKTLDENREHSSPINDELSYIDTVTDKWNNNKYSKTKMNIGVHEGISNAIIAFEDAGITPPIEKLNALRVKLDKEIKDEIVSMNPVVVNEALKGKDINKVSHDVSGIAMEVLDILAKASAK